MNVPKYSEAPYPFNLFIRLHEINDAIPCHKDDMYEDWYGTLQYMLIERITQRERKVLHLRFQQNFTLDQSSKEMGLSKERIRQIEERALSKLALGVKSSILVYGLSKLISAELKSIKPNTRVNKVKATIEEECLIAKSLRLAKDPLTMDIGRLGMTTYITNALRRARYETVQDILNIVSIAELIEIKGIGRSSARTILNVRDILEKIMKERESAKEGPDRPLYELDLSVRAFNALRRHGYETVRDIIDLNESDILALRNIGKKTLNEIVTKIENERKKLNVSIAP